MSMDRVLRILSFGDRLVPYDRALALQKQLWASRHAGECLDTLITLQHTPVYTIGKRGQESDFRIAQEEVARRGAEVLVVPRGGQVTFHGPGQLVAYPIFALRSLGFGARAFVEGLEDSMIRVAAEYGVKAEGRIPGRTGVWVGGASDGRKLGAVGVQISQGVSLHGIALNVSTDLSFFDLIVPCGVADRKVTSLTLEVAAAANSKFKGAAGPPVVYGEVEARLQGAIAERYRFTEVRVEDGWAALPPADGRGESEVT